MSLKQELKNFFIDLVSAFNMPELEQKHVPATTVTKQAYNIGDVLPDGWFVGPVSPETGIVMAVKPISGGLNGYHTWGEGYLKTKKLRDEGNANARLPSLKELRSLYNEIVKTGRNDNTQFKTSDNNKSFYWSGTPSTDLRPHMQQMTFNSGRTSQSPTGARNAFVCCVRDEPNITLAP